MRTLLALLGLAGSFVAALAVAGYGETSQPALAGSLACLVAGFVGLRLARSPHAPARPLHITVSVCCVITVAMLAGLAWPPARGDVSTWLTLLFTMALGAAAVAVARRNPRLAALLLTVPALNAGWSVIRSTQAFAAAGGEALGPSFILAYFVAASMAAGWLIAPWHAWNAGAPGDPLVSETSG